MEYTSQDEADEQRFKKMDRLGKAVIISAEAETSEIIRRRRWFVACRRILYRRSHKTDIPKKIVTNVECKLQDKEFHLKGVVMTEAKNVLGGKLETCCTSPMTGFYRDGKCSTGAGDFGVHVVCAEMTEEFLTFTKSRGNDLSTPVPTSNFPGLKPGDRWCLCASRWQEALDAGVAPPVILSATHASAVEHVSLDQLKQHAVKS